MDDDLVFKALADPTRRLLLDALFEHDRIRSIDGLRREAVFDVRQRSSRRERFGPEAPPRIARSQR